MTDKGIIWIIGANGHLGTGLTTRLTDAGYSVVGTDIELDITDIDRLEAFARELRPLAIVNCAGIRRDSVGLSNRIKAYEVNALGAHNVALVAEAVNAITIQVSTDDVYSANITEPVNEFDSPNPDTPYGKSKRAGELMVRDTTKRHIILRSSWLYRSEGSRLGHILEAAKNGETIEARTDHFAAPTSLATYTKFMVRALEKERFGTFHVATRGKCSHYEFAKKALEICGYDPEKILIPTEDPATAENIVLEAMMVEIAGKRMPTWEEDLESYLKEQGLA